MSFREKLISFYKDCMSKNYPNIDFLLEHIFDTIDNQEINHHLVCNLDDNLNVGSDQRKIFRKALFELSTKQIEFLYILSKRESDDDIALMKGLHRICDDYDCSRCKEAD